MYKSARHWWRTAVKLAWRDLRSSPGRFLFVVIAVAVGVGSLTGVRSFSRAFAGMLLRDARTLMAADLTVRIFGLPTAEQTALLQRLEQRGIQRTPITETLTMVSSAEVSEPLLVSIKAVDPALYPFYGAVKLNPPRPLRELLDSRSVVVSDDLLMRLHTRVGDEVRIGGQPFRIRGVLVSEPDRMTGTLNVGPRLMLSREGLDRTGLIRVGSRASERFLFRLPAAGANVARVRAILKRSFPEATIADFRETHPVINRGLRRSTMFLSLISLIALIVGALGVATAMQAHLQQKLDHIAVLKCLGARSAQVLRIYVAETLILGLAGGGLGVLAGLAIERAFPILIARYFSLAPAFQWDAAPAVQGLTIAVLTTLLFTVPPLLGVRAIRPAVIFRREMAERGAEPRGWMRSRSSLATGAVIVTGLALIAAWLAGTGLGGSLRIGAVFALGLTVSLAVLAAVAWFLFTALRAFLRGSRRALPVAIRQGLANLYRPGTHAGAVTVALGVGVMFTVSVYLLQSSLVGHILSSAPPGMANVFLLDIPANERAGLLDLLKQQRGVERLPEVMGSVAAKLVTVDGVRIQDLPLKNEGRRFLRTRSVTWIGQKPPETEVLAGTWWKADARPAVPEVCATEETARNLSLKPGSRLVWEIAGRRLESQVACVQRTESIRMAARFEFLFSPGVLESFPAVYYGGMRVKPRDVAPLARAVYARFPTITVVNIADVLQIVQEVVDQIALVIRFLSLFAIAAGAVILASSVAGTRFRRIREVVILKTLGASRRRVAAIFSVEFLVIGAVAGLIGGLLATAFSAFLLDRFLEVKPEFDMPAILLAMLSTALLAVAAGWLASFRILGQKPLEILRQE